MRIAICDDNKAHTEILQGMIKCWSEQGNIKIDINCFQSAEQFLFMMKDEAHYDLAFLDIQMGKMNGLELLEQL